MAVYDTFSPLAFQFIPLFLCGGFTLAGHQEHTKAVLLLSSSAWQWRENIKNG